MICIGIGSKEVLGAAHMVVNGLNDMNIEKISILEKQLGYE